MAEMRIQLIWKIGVVLAVLFCLVPSPASTSPLDNGQSLSVPLARFMRSKGCDCDYHSGGCTISMAPAQGNKCVCVYRGAWSCAGHSVGCEKNEDCPTGCTSKSCCHRAGGDCGGYH